jgi:hypothetical protein
LHGVLINKTIRFEVKKLKSVGEVVKTKRKNEGRGGKKKQKMEDENGVAWIEEVTPEYTERTNLLG